MLADVIAGSEGSSWRAGNALASDAGNQRLRVLAWGAGGQ